MEAALTWRDGAPPDVALTWRAHTEQRAMRPATPLARGRTMARNRQQRSAATAACTRAHDVK